MLINYEYNNHLYKVNVERKEDRYFVTYDDNTYTVKAEEIKAGHLKMKVGDRVIKAAVSEVKDEKYVFIKGDVFKINKMELSGVPKKKAKKKGDLSSPISGKVIKIEVKEGDGVEEGDVLMVIEAMKMEYLIKAPYPGEIEKINFEEGDQIEIGETTVDMKEKEGD